MTLGKSALVGALVFVATGLGARGVVQDKKTANQVILITPDQEFVEKGSKDNKPVKVIVGSAVIWDNQDAIKHSAESEMLDPATMKPLFDTGLLTADEVSKPIAFTAEMFKKAGGRPGGSVLIPYFCRPHKKSMKGMILLIDKTK